MVDFFAVPRPWRKAVALLVLWLVPAFTAPTAQARVRLIIDTDAALERDDQHAIAYALLSPDQFEIMGITAVHNGAGTMEKNFLEIHTILELSGVGGIPVLHGADTPLKSSRAPVESAAAQFMVEATRQKGKDEIVILGLGAATNLASALLLDPEIKDRVTFVWQGGAAWPDGEGGEHNSLMDVEAQRVLFGAKARLVVVPPGNNRVTTSRWAESRHLRGVSPLADYLNLLLMYNRFGMDTEFSLPAMCAITALAQPDMVSHLGAKAPWVDDHGGYDQSRSFGDIEVLTGLDEELGRGPRSIWHEFFRKIRAAAPNENTIYEQVNRVLNVPPAPPYVQPVVGKVEEFKGFTRQEVSWPSLFGQSVPAYVCVPRGSSDKRRPAVICLSGTHGDRILLTTEFFGIANYTSLGRSEPQKPLPQFEGWAAELARRGYVTLSLTQRGLGDRGFNGDNQSKALLVQGFTMQGVLAYEIRQGLSYLQSRPDVDSARVACTGVSFGGITTFFATATDPRFKLAAPIIGGVGSWRHMLTEGSPGFHGVYWWVPGIMQHFDQGDIVAAQAPRPYFIIAPTEDIGMPKEGVQELLDKAMPYYERAGAPGNLVAYRPPGPHDFTPDMFEELVQFLDSHL